MIVIGVGCRKDCSADEIVGLINRTLTQCGLTIKDASIIATASIKLEEVMLKRAAVMLGLKIKYVPREELEAVAVHAKTISPRVLALHEIPSIAETAALAAAGKNATLLMPRITSNAAACAIAKGDDA